MAKRNIFTGQTFRGQTFKSVTWDGTPTAVVRPNLKIVVGGIELMFPAPDIPAPVRVTGVTHLTAGGGIAQYRTGAPSFYATLTIPRLTNAIKDVWEAYYRTNWGLAFEYIDEVDNVFEARFMDDTLQFTKVARELWTFSMRLRLDAVLI